MDVVDRMVEHDIWLTRRLLEAAEGLADRLDERVGVEPQAPYAFPQEEPSVRQMHDRLVFSKETWTAALAGRDVGSGDPIEWERRAA